MFFVVAHVMPITRMLGMSRWHDAHFTQVANGRENKNGFGDIWSVELPAL
jgi:hypothetical protein